MSTAGDGTRRNRVPARTRKALERARPTDTQELLEPPLDLAGAATADTHFGPGRKQQPGGAVSFHDRLLHVRNAHQIGPIRAGEPGGKPVFEFRQGVVHEDVNPLDR